MFALDRASRTALAASAFVSFGAAFVTTPTVARGDAEPVPASTLTVTRLPARIAVADVVPRRDPFVGDDEPRRDTGVAQLPVPTPIGRPLVDVAPSLHALPPNAGAGDSLFPFAVRSAVVVTAVVTGSHPLALVEDAGTPRVVTIGDRIGTDAIVAIGIDGIRMTGGAVFRVAQGDH